MIVLMLQGGLANQMFQYAVARRLALLRHTSLQIDTSWYDKAAQTDGVGKRVYELGPMNIEEHIYQPTLANRVLIKTSGAGIYSDEAQPYVFHPEVLELPNYSRLFGFFQNERYFADIRDVLLKEFTLKAAPTGKNKTLLAEIEANPQAVSLHVRRGDYVSSAAHAAHHGAKGLDYYTEAVKVIKKTAPKPTFYVFSDDPEWCKQNIKLGAPTVYVDHNTYGGEDMRLMKACRHNIIANSSFSWWGAWLNTNPDKVVVAPKQWVNDAAMDSSDVVPKSWLRI
jgi:glycosyl transferase family 11